MSEEAYRPKGKSYLCVNDDEILKIDSEYVTGLKERKSKNPENKCMLCLHNDIRASLHEMINVYDKGEYIRPHYHPNKTETKIVLEGNMMVILFDDDGVIKERIILSGKEKACFLLRIEKGIIHCSIPITDVVYYEATTGPYTGKDDSVYPEWAPAKENAKEIRELYARINIDKYVK